MINKLEDLKEYGYNINNLNVANWHSISTYQLLSEDFIREFQDKVNWYCISMCQVLSESFIREFQDKVDWFNISAYQLLSEDFIREFKDMVDWWDISRYQLLSESFIREFQNKVDWDRISGHQVLSESFIREFQYKVSWVDISIYQILSESFIREFKDKINWRVVFIYQVLSESFIREFQGMAYWGVVTNYQLLSDKFREEFHLSKPDDSLLYASVKCKKQLVLDSKRYECYGDYFYAYKRVRRDRYSCFKFHYKYDIGNIYETKADYDKNENYSFGFNVYSKEYIEGKMFKSNDTIIKIKIYYKDVAYVDGDTIRCSKMTIMD